MEKKVGISQGELTSKMHQCDWEQTYVLIKLVPKYIENAPPPQKNTNKVL